MNYNGYVYQTRRVGTNSNSGDRQFFFPFLTGALVGGAAVGLTRPRPIYNVAPQSGYNYGGSPYYGAPYSYYSYGGYVPGPYGY
jgi:hypothetical protein